MEKYDSSTTVQCILYNLDCFRFKRIKKNTSRFHPSFYFNISWRWFHPSPSDNERAKPEGRHSKGASTNHVAFFDQFSIPPSPS